MDPSSDPTIRPNVQTLKIPDSYSDKEENENQTKASREEWLEQASSAISRLRNYLDTSPVLTEEDVAHLIIACAPFQTDHPWTTPTLRVAATDILTRYDEPNASLVRLILSKHVRSAFQANVHPSVNVNTGRRIPARSAGALSQQDYLENQVWKTDLGLLDVLVWCLCHLDTRAYEELWPFVIPPIMTFLDDYEVKYKLQGILLVQHLLKGAAPELLKRTGLDELMFISVKKCMSFLHNPLTPPLLRATIPISVALIEATTSPGSAQRFDQLCEILGDGIIGSVWTYGSREPEAIEATLETLPIVISALGVGIARYMKAIVPQLLHPLVASAENVPSVHFQLLSVRALVSVMDHCPARVSHWKDHILDGIARAWTTLNDSGLEESQDLRSSLRCAAETLARICPALKTLPDDEFGFPALLRTDANLFGSLLCDAGGVA